MSISSQTADSFEAHPRKTKVIRAPSFSPVRIQADIAELYQYRDLLLTLTAHRVKVRYKQSILGVAWAIVQPFSLMLIYTLIFTYIARVPMTGTTPYPIVLYSALLIWTFFSTALTSATNGLVSHTHLVTKVYFPREILPLSYVLAGLFDLLIASPILIGLMIYYGVPISIYALYAIPIALILTVVLTSASLVLSAAQVHFRDIGMALPLVLQIWMFASPVVYPISAVPERFRAWYLLNPMAGIVENFRRVLVEAAPPNFAELGVSALIAVVFLPIAYIIFKHTEAKIADVI